MRRNTRCHLFIFVAVLGAFWAPPDTYAQTPLIYVNSETRVQDLVFRFPDTKTFDASALEAQIATAAPTGTDRLRRIVPFVKPRVYPFDPIVLQKDMVRLRNFYRRNGFLKPEIDYPASQLDTTRNSIRVIITVFEGQPILIDEVTFALVDGDSTFAGLPGPLLERWENFRRKIALRSGDRYTDIERIRIQDEILKWYKDRGYAFVRIDSDVRVDTTASRADIEFGVDPGPVSYFSDIEVSGNELVSRDIVVRELPFKSGQRFSQTQLSRGQQQLFGLNLFRLALTEVPPQERDSTVTVRIRVREGKHRVITGQAGYSVDEGLSVQGGWQHRNFGGGARNFSLDGIANSGLLGREPTDQLISRLFRFSASLRQPYIFTTRLSGSIAPFLQFETDPQLLRTDTPFEINRRELGVTTTFLYELLPQRVVSARYVLSRELQLTGARDSTETTMRDPFNKSIVTLNATFGWTNSLFNPRRGYLVKPFVETGGTLFGSEITYIKIGADAVGYIPITTKTSVSLGAFYGRLWPTGSSREALDGELGRADSLRFEDRFDKIVFYAGGPDDVRGWATGLLGPRIARQLSDGTDGRFVYEAVGGLSKATFSAELRLPFPGLGDKWRLATFLDAGQVSSRQTTDENGSVVFTDRGSISLREFSYGTGAGIRYRTPVGFVRFDIAFKINPSSEDLLTPRDSALGIDNERLRRRFNFHLSIGQSF